MDINITPKNPESNWLTIGENNNLISEGKTPNEAIELATKITNNFSLIFVPKKDITYIFNNKKYNS